MRHSILVIISYAVFWAASASAIGCADDNTEKERYSVLVSINNTTFIQKITDLNSPIVFSSKKIGDYYIAITLNEVVGDNIVFTYTLRESNRVKGSLSSLEFRQKSKTINSDGSTYAITFYKRSK